jgi:hypothetical protein
VRWFQKQVSVKKNSKAVRHECALPEVFGPPF